MMNWRLVELDDSVLADAGLRRQLEQLRHRGHAGGFISPHRALLVSPRNRTKLLTASLLAAGLLLCWYAVLDLVSRAWLEIMEFWRVALGISGYTTMTHYRLGGILRLDVPFLHVESQLPAAGMWWAGAILVLGLVIVSLLLPRRFLHYAYMLRIGAFFQACAQVFFAFWLRAFPYSAGGYIHGMLIASLMFVSLMPIVLGLTYYIFDFHWRQKIGLTLVIMVHGTIMIPMQYVFHALVLVQASLLFMPVLFFIFGLPLNVLVFIALYGWGFSWDNVLREEAVQGKVHERIA